MIPGVAAPAAATAVVPDVAALELVTGEAAEPPGEADTDDSTSKGAEDA